MKDIKTKNATVSIIGENVSIGYRIDHNPDCPIKPLMQVEKMTAIYSEYDQNMIDESLAQLDHYDKVLVSAIKLQPHIDVHQAQLLYQNDELRNQLVLNHTRLIELLIPTGYEIKVKKCFEL